MNRALLTGIAVVAGLLFLTSQCIFFVNARQRAIVLQLGEAVESSAREPGINYKLPFIQNVVFFENRILVFEIAKTESLTSDLKAFEIDNYVCWRITNPLLFYRTLRTEFEASDRLRNIVYSQLRAAIGSRELNEVVFTKRTEIMAEVLQKSDQQAREYGVSIVDVRIKRTDLPNRQAIFARMNAERKRMANKYRSEGESEYRRIHSEAELQRDIILARADKESTIIRGSADARVIAVFAGALSIDPDFYEFVASLDLYKKAFGANTRFVFSSGDPLLRHLNR